MLGAVRVDRELTDALALRSGAWNEVDGLERASSLGDLRRQLAERLLARVELDPDRDAVLSGGSHRALIIGGPPRRGRGRSYDGYVPTTTQKKAPAKGTKGKKKAGELFLIDGNSLAYRAFFALPESIATHDGRPTNAIYGLASMFAKMLIDHDPAAVVVCWDAGWSGRELTYEPYKSQRKPRPDLLRDQWPHLMPLAESFGFTNIKVDGYEADDVIASLTRRAREEGLKVMVVSGDRDVYQLVEDGVRVMTTSRGVTDTKIYDRDGVIERYGVSPELVTDLIGLKGDTSDNIPGVPGIGDKTAAQLLQEYGDLEGVLANIDKISGAKRKENLTNHTEDARISKQLATAITDIDVELDLDELMAKQMDRSRLREVAREFELRVILQRLEEELGADFVPDSKVEEELDATAEEGGIDDLAKGEVALAIAGEMRGRAAAEGEARPVRWVGYDGKKLMEGRVPGSRRAGVSARRSQADRPRPEEPRRRGAAWHPGRRRSRRPLAPPRHDGRRLPARPSPPHLRPGRHRRAARARGRAQGSGRRGWRPARAGRGAAARSGRRGPAGLGDRPAPAQGDEGARDRASHGRGRDAADRGARSDGADRRASGHRSGSPTSARASSSGSRPCRPRSSSSPVTSSRSARPSSSPRSCSTSSA